MNNFEYKKAGRIEEAVNELDGNSKAMFIAGGTNLLDLYKYDILHPEVLIDINHLDSNRNIEEIEDGKVRLGAFVSNADTAYHAIIESRYPLLSKAILAGASGQIRNMASNGGNLLQKTRCYYFYDVNVPCNKREPGSGCSAIHGQNRIHAVLGASEHCIAVFPSDMCVALLALDATVNVTGKDGERTIKFENFHRLPGDTPEIDNNLNEGELITSIDLPKEGFSENYSYLKLRDRDSYAFALVSVATGLKLEGDTIKEARIALGGVAHTPWRNKDAEEFLVDKVANESNFSAVADMIMKDAVGFEHNEFKIELAKKAIVRNGMMALNPESQRPGAKPSA